LNKKLEKGINEQHRALLKLNDDFKINAKEQDDINKEIEKALSEEKNQRIKEANDMNKFFRSVNHIFNHCYFHC